MNIMDAQQLREAYVKFFEERGHAHIGSASLIPENDPTVQKMIKYNKLAEKFPPLFGFFAFFQCLNVS